LHLCMLPSRGHLEDSDFEFESRSGDSCMSRNFAVLRRAGSMRDPAQNIPANVQNYSTGTGCIYEN
jgi:hypothetical protein